MWKALYFSDDEMSYPLDTYSGFFTLTIDAHASMFFIRAFTLVDNQSSGATFYRLLNLARRNPDLVPDVNITAQVRRFKRLESARKRIKLFRDKRAAHWDRNAMVINLTVEDAEGVLHELHGIMNEFRIAHTGSGVHHELWQPSNVTDLVRTLAEHHQIISTVNMIAWTAAKDPSDPDLSRVRTEHVIKLQQVLKSTS